MLPDKQHPLFLMLNYFPKKVHIGYHFDHRVGLGFPTVRSANGGCRKFQFAFKIKSATSLLRNLNIYIIYFDKISRKYLALLRLQ